MGGIIVNKKEYMKNFFIATKSIYGKREYQDDYLETKEFDDGSAILILADGMGGYAGGAMASETVVRKFKETFCNIRKRSSSFDVKDVLHTSLIEANKALAEAKNQNPKFNKMGTTLVAVYIDVDFIQWVSVGDSPLWIIGKKYKNGIKRINKNHSIAGLLELQYQHDEITEEERDSSPNRHMLTSAITGEELKSIDLSDKFEIDRDDIVILASDGVETLTTKKILNIIDSKAIDIVSAAENVLKAVEDEGLDDQDNTSIIIISNKNEEKPKIQKLKRVEINTLIKDNIKDYNNQKSIKDKLNSIFDYNYNLILTILFSIIILLSLIILLQFKQKPIPNPDINILTNNKVDDNLLKKDNPTKSAIIKDKNSTREPKVSEKSIPKNTTKEKNETNPSLPTNITNADNNKSKEVNSNKDNKVIKAFNSIDTKKNLDSLKTRTAKETEVLEKEQLKDKGIKNDK